MKKIIFTALFLYSIIGNAQIKYNGDIKLGYETLSYVYMSTHMKSPIMSYMGEFGVISSYKGFYISSYVHTNFTYYKGGKNFTPLLVEYELKTGYKFGNYSVIYEHSCFHTVVNPHGEILIHGGRDRLYLEIKF